METEHKNISSPPPVRSVRPPARVVECLAALLLVSGWAPSRADDAPANWVTNGDLTDGTAAAGQGRRPAGWLCSEALVAATMTEADGGGYLQIRADAPPAGGAYVTQTIPYDRRGGKISGFEFSCDVKFKDCTEGPKGYMTARALLLYSTADGVLHDRLSRKFIGSSDWRGVSIPCTLPADTTKIQVLLGFHTSMGTLSVRRVRLIQVDSPRPAPDRVPGVVIKALAPGMVETDYGVARTLKVGEELWFELPGVDPAAEWYNLPDADGVFDRAFVRGSDWTDAEKARGFVVYQHPATMIAPSRHIPRRGQVLDGDRPVAMSLCAGETRSAVAIVHPLRDLPSVGIRFGELTGAAGAVIQPENLRADRVETMVYRANTYRQYVRMPRAIVRFDAMDLPAGNPSQFWIYCTAPDDARPGVYEGTASILSQGRDIGQIPLRVEVYPFKLAPVPAQWSMYFYYPPNEELLRELKYMQSLGMNSVIYSPPAQSMFDRLSIDGEEVSFDFAPDDIFMAAYKKAGYTRPVIYYPRLLLLRLVELTCPPGKQLPRAAFHTTTVPLISSEAEYPPAARRAYKRAIRLIADHAKRANWPEMILYLTDEPFETIWREFETGVSYKLAKEVCPQIKTYCTVYGTPLIEKYGRHIDYISCRGLQRAAPRPQNAEFLAACAKTGSRPWASCWPTPASSMCGAGSRETISGSSPERARAPHTRSRACGRAAAPAVSKCSGGRRAATIRTQPCRRGSAMAFSTPDTSPRSAPPSDGRRRPAGTSRRRKTNSTA